MRVSNRTAVVLGAVASLLLASVVIFALAIPRYSNSKAPITTNDWEILSNTRLSNWSINVTQLPFGRQIRTPSEEEFRRVLKLLMPFEVTTDLHDDHFDYELIYQGGKDPTHIYIDARGDDMRFWINARPAVYRSQSRDAFLNAITLIVNKPSA